MLAILATHPIQYQVPIWKKLAEQGKVPFEVLYLTAHGVQPSLDAQFGKIFKWDIDMLGGYPHKFPPEPVPQQLGGFWSVGLPSDFRNKLKSGSVKALLVHGWNVRACWDAVFLAHRLGIPVWLRGESNDLKVDNLSFKKLGKRWLLGAFLNRIDHFLAVGKANARLYRHYGMTDEKLSPSPYCVDNSYFSMHASLVRSERITLRRGWNIPDDAFCILFVGKFIPKKNPADLVDALRLLVKLDPSRHYHILFVGAGELGTELRSQCEVIFDADGMPVVKNDAVRPVASFAGFLNQSEITRAYVAADALVLPSDSQETWGLVVNEALASGLPCIVSNACGSAEDLVVPLDPLLCYPVGDCVALAGAIKHLAEHPVPAEMMAALIREYDFAVTVETLERLWHELPAS